MPNTVSDTETANKTDEILLSLSFYSRNADATAETLTIQN